MGTKKELAYEAGSSKKRETGLEPATACLGSRVYSTLASYLALWHIAINRASAILSPRIPPCKGVCDA
jgi:hypothetical protein